MLGLEVESLAVNEIDDDICYDENVVVVAGCRVRELIGPGRRN